MSSTVRTCNCTCNNNFSTEPSVRSRATALCSVPYSLLMQCFIGRGRWPNPVALYLNALSALLFRYLLHYLGSPPQNIRGESAARATTTIHVLRAIVEPYAVQ
jgi:hypothetical protein